MRKGRDKPLSVLGPQAQHRTWQPKNARPAASRGATPPNKSSPERRRRFDARNANIPYEENNKIRILPSVPGSMGALRGAGCAGARAGCAILRHRAPAGSRSARFGRPPRGDTPQRYPVGRPPFRNRGRPSGPPLPTRHSSSPQQRTTSRRHTGKQSPRGHPSPHSLTERPPSARR